MAKVIQVVLVKSITFQDNRRKFKQNVPVTMTDKAEIAKYRDNGMFSVREIEDPTASSAEAHRPAGDPYKAPVNETTTRLPSRKKKAVKKLTPKPKE